MNGLLYVSIIIPMYEGKQFIESTVKNALMIQHSKEIIIVDDGSSDNSYDFCVKLFSNNADVKIFKKENSGVAETRNHALERASGKYIVFVDQDDTLVADTVDKSIEICESEQCDMLFWETEHLFIDGSKSVCSEIPVSCALCEDEIKNVLMPSALIEEVINKYNSNIGLIWAILFRREFILSNNLRFKKFIDCEDDYLFIIDSLLYAKKVYQLSEVGYLWLYNRNSYSNSIRHIDNYIEKSEKYFEYSYNVYAQCTNNKELLEQYRSYAYQRTAIGAIKNDGGYKVINRKGINQINNYLNRKEVKVGIHKADISPRLKFDKLLLSLIRSNLLLTAICATWLYTKLVRIRNKQ